LVPDNNVTEILGHLRDGDESARARLLDVVYAELRRLAGAHMARERRDHTLQPTALVHEAYLKLLGADAAFQDGNHFFNAAARAMRSILVDHARARATAKRGGGGARVALDDTTPGPHEAADEVLAVHESLARLERVNPDLGRVVELRYFAGLSFPETARAMGVHERTVHRLWDRARAWLQREMSP
jgi:RNA polymerase sigma factor (TIGR02999 family)